jgi:hypothetical protein
VALIWLDLRIVFRNFIELKEIHFELALAFNLINEVQLAVQTLLNDLLTALLGIHVARLNSYWILYKEEVVADHLIVTNRLLITALPLLLPEPNNGVVSAAFDILSSDHGLGHA